MEDNNSNQYSGGDNNNPADAMPHSPEPATKNAPEDFQHTPFENTAQQTDPRFQQNSGSYGSSFRENPTEPGRPQTPPPGYPYPPRPMQQGQDMYVNVGLPFIKNLAGWATFKAIIDIIGGALACIFIITAAYGIPQIIAGVKLLNATEEFKKYLYSNDSDKISMGLFNMSKYFKLNGIATIVKISLSIVAIILYIVLIASLVSQGYTGDFDFNF